jgi:two-component system, OmpR family, response regulator
VGVAGTGVDHEDDVMHIAVLEHVERSLHGGPAVTVVRWPDQRERIDELRRLGVPRLLVVGTHDDPVVPSDVLEDWIRVPCDDRDIRTRLACLREHAESAPRRPELDGAGRLLFAGRWVALSVVEERLARPLVEQFGRVVGYDELLHAGWPDEPKGKNLLRPRVSGLRRRVAALGLELRSVREVGHVLEPCPPRRSSTAPFSSTTPVSSTTQGF